MRNDILNNMLPKQNVIYNLIESLPNGINSDNLNDFLYKNDISLTKEEFLSLCYFIKGDDDSPSKDVSIKELKCFIENNNSS